MTTTVAVTTEFSFVVIGQFNMGEYAISPTVKTGAHDDSPKGGALAFLYLLALLGDTSSPL